MVFLCPIKFCKGLAELQKPDYPKTPCFPSLIFLGNDGSLQKKTPNPEPELSNAALVPQAKWQRAKPCPADTQRLALKLAFRGLLPFSPAASFQQQSTKKKDLGKMKSGWDLKGANSCCSM